jgi:hypothetical protein
MGLARGGSNPPASLLLFFIFLSFFLFFFCFFCFQLFFSFFLLFFWWIDLLSFVFWLSLFSFLFSHLLSLPPRTGSPHQLPESPRERTPASHKRSHAATRHKPSQTDTPTKQLTKHCQTAPTNNQQHTEKHTQSLACQPLRRACCAQRHIRPVQPSFTVIPLHNHCASKRPGCTSFEIPLDLLVSVDIRPCCLAARASNKTECGCLKSWP